MLLLQELGKMEEGRKKRQADADLKQKEVSLFCMVVSSCMFL